MAALATIRVARGNRSAADIPRVRTLRIGYVPLSDAAPLLAAKALGYFEKAGLQVLLAPELGWGSIREKLAYGELDAAHAPGGLLYSILNGTHARPCEVKTDLILSLQGNAITLSRRLWQKGVRDAESLRLMIRSEMPRKPVFAVVSPFSSHLYLLRTWLRSARINPDNDVRIAVLPPPLVGEHMREGHIDGFCVGEPWNSISALAGEGWIAATSEMLAPRHPEKILITNASLMPTEEYRKLREVIVEACRWCDDPNNRAAVVDLLRADVFRGVSREALANAFSNSLHNGMELQPAREPLLCFHRHDANEVSPQRANWFLENLKESHALQGTAQIQTYLRAFQSTPIHHPTHLWTT